MSIQMSTQKKYPKDILEYPKKYPKISKIGILRYPNKLNPKVGKSVKLTDALERGIRAKRSILARRHPRGIRTCLLLPIKRPYTLFIARCRHPYFCFFLFFLLLPLAAHFVLCAFRKLFSFFSFFIWSWFHRLTQSLMPCLYSLLFCSFLNISCFPEICWLGQRRADRLFHPSLASLYYDSSARFAPFSRMKTFDVEFLEQFDTNSICFSETLMDFDKNSFCFALFGFLAFICFFRAQSYLIRRH